MGGRRVLLRPTAGSIASRGITNPNDSPRRTRPALTSITIEPKKSTTCDNVVGSFPRPCYRRLRDNSGPAHPTVFVGVACLKNRGGETRQIPAPTATNSKPIDPSPSDRASLGSMKCSASVTTGARPPAAADESSVVVSVVGGLEVLWCSLIIVSPFLLKSVLRRLGASPNPQA